MSQSVIPISDEQARLGQEILRTLRGLGSFLEKALGSTPEDLVGYLGGDWLRVRRAQNIARLLQDTQDRLTQRGVEQPKPASLSVALPILRGAADEDRDELVDLWARLLANAMDPNLDGVRYLFIEAVRIMDPIDATILRFLDALKFNRIFLGESPNESLVTNIRAIAGSMGKRADEIEISIRHLEELRFLTPLPSLDPGWNVNATNREFMRACYPEIGR